MQLEKEGSWRYPYPEGIGRVLEELASVLCLSEGRIYQHARAGRIIGIDYDHGVWRFSARPGLEGPVSDQPQEYLVPPGELRGVYAQLISGAVSGQLYVGRINSTKKKNLVEFYGVVSGANCRPVVDYHRNIKKGG